MHHYDQALFFPFCLLLLRPSSCLLAPESLKLAMGRNYDTDECSDLETLSSDNSSKADVEMTLSDMENWKELFGAGYIHADGTHTLHCVLDFSTVASPVSSIQNDHSHISDDAPKVTDILMNESTAPSPPPSISQDSGASLLPSLSNEICMAQKLFTRTSSKDQSITFGSSFLCSNCAICNVIEEFRPCSAMPHINKFIPEEEADREQKFWSRLDRSINRMYWVAFRSNRSKAKYPITRMHHKEMIPAHYLMKNYEDEDDTKFFMMDLEKDNDLWFLESGVEHLNAIQVEEMRFAEALKRVISHYSKRSYESDMLSRIEALDVAENIILSLRVLLEVEFGLRKELL